MPSLYDKNIPYLFIHIPKCGGMSLTEYFEKMSAQARGDQGYEVEKGDQTDGLKISFDANNKANAINRNWQILHARALDYKGALSDTDYEKAFSFSVVRNPWTRLGSLYHYIRMKPQNPHHKKVMTQTLDEYVLEHCEKFRSVQACWVSDLQGNLIVDEIVRFENLENGIKKISEKIFGKSSELPKNNVSANGRTPLKFKDTTIDVVREIYRPDFELFGYPDHPED